MTTAILVQRRTGGNLALALGRLSDRLEERAQLARELRGATAQARMTAWLVAALPLAGGALTEMVAPGTLARDLGQGPGAVPARRRARPLRGRRRADPARRAGGRVMPPPLVLWLVAIAAAALGPARPPGARRGRGGAAAGRPPALLARAAGLPWPRRRVGPLGPARATRGRSSAPASATRSRRRGSPAPGRRSVLAGLVARRGARRWPRRPPRRWCRCWRSAGVWAPGRWLAGRVRARGRALLRELPDLLDLLAICVESGMALDPALAVTGRRLGGALGEEVGLVLRDLSLGTPRAAAYRALVERAGLPELARTVGALLQAEELGAPLSRALHGQAESLRAARRQAARDRAARAAPKIQLVVAMVMVPAILLLVIGVLAIEMARQVGAVIG